MTMKTLTLDSAFSLVGSDLVFSSNRFFFEDYLLWSAGDPCHVSGVVRYPDQYEYKILVSYGSSMMELFEFPLRDAWKWLATADSRHDNALKV